MKNGTAAAAAAAAKDKPQDEAAAAAASSAGVAAVASGAGPSFVGLPAALPAKAAVAASSAVPARTDTAALQAAGPAATAAGRGWAAELKELRLLLESPARAGSGEAAYLCVPLFGCACRSADHLPVLIITAEGTVLCHLYTELPDQLY
jgi:hypothetical protein